MSETIISLPWPPSGNHRLGRNGKKQYRTPKYAAYVETVAKLYVIHRGHRFGKERVTIHYIFHPPTNARYDMDNMRKTINDALEGIAFNDDEQIYHDRAWKAEVEKNGRVLVSISICDEPGMER